MKPNDDGTPKDSNEKSYKHEGKPIKKLPALNKVPIEELRRQDGIRAEGASLRNLRQRHLDPALVRGEKPPTPDVVAAGLAGGLVKKQHIDQLLNRGFGIAAHELDRLYMKSLDEGLTPTETQQYERLVKAIKALASEEREQINQDRMDDVTDADLIKRATEIMTGKKAE